jgi:hypothetical protein
MDCETMEALRNVIEYLRESERNSYDEASESEKETHIYRDVLTLERYLDGDDAQA